jgi:hypothetical protein
MIIVDENGNYKLVDGSLKPVTSEHPVHKARIALGLPIGEWLFAPTVGHDLKQYKNVKASESMKSEFQKSVALYLKDFGPDVVSVFTDRGVLTEKLEIREDALNG